MSTRQRQSARRGARPDRPRRARAPARGARAPPPRRRGDGARAQAAGRAGRGACTAAAATPLDPRARRDLGRASCPASRVPDYRLAVTYDGAPHEVDDPYRFLPTLGEIDLHLINEGRHEQLWQVLGARVHHYEAPLRRHRERHVVRGVGAEGPRASG